MEHAETVKKLLQSPDIVAALVNDLPYFSTDLFKNFISQAQDTLKNVVFNAAKNNLTAILLPQSALLSKLYNGLTFVLNPQTQNQIKSILTNFFAGIDTVLTGDVASSGNFVRDTLNKSITLVLDFVQSQLLGPNFSLPNKVSDLVRKIDLRVWIQKGVERLWEKIKAEVPGNVLGARLTDKLAVGDPSYIWGATTPGNNIVIHFNEGEFLLGRLAKWKSEHASNADLVQEISKVEALTTQLQGSQIFKNVVVTREARNIARKTARIPGRADPVEQATAKVVESQQKASQELKDLQFKLGKLLPKLAAGSKDCYSGLRFVPRTKVLPPLIMKVKGHETRIYGMPQKPTGANGDNHANLVMQKVTTMVNTGDYEYIVMDLSWRTATGRVSKSTLEPDILGIRCDGRIDAFEVASPGQTKNFLLERIKKGYETLLEGEEWRKGDYDALGVQP